MRKRTLEEFVEEARKVHGNKYGYDKFIYVGANIKGIIDCCVNEHGEFEQSPSTHLRGSKCPKCAQEKRSVDNCSTKQEFVSKANIVHNGKYIYDLFEYGGTLQKGIIICPVDEHGKFEQDPAHHLYRKQGCPKCGFEKVANEITLTANEVITKFNKLYNNKYDYSKFIYAGMRMPGTVICPVDNHGIFIIKPHAHLYNQQECPKCVKLAVKANGKKSGKGSGRGRKITITTVDFIARANVVHNNKYIYTKFTYNHGSKKEIIICPFDKHGEFLQSPNNHILGRGCPECGYISRGEKSRYTKEIFIEKANVVHNFRYIYPDNLIYLNGITKVPIICPDCGPFMQTPEKHLQGQGCPDCLFKNQKIVATILGGLGICYKKITIITGERRYYPDFYLPDFNTIIEYNGAQHYKPVKFGNRTNIEADIALEKQRIRDENLRQYCNDKEIKLLEIPGHKIYGWESIYKFIVTNIDL